MSEKHYPYIGGTFDRIVFDGDGSAWVPEAVAEELKSRDAELEKIASDMYRAFQRVFPDGHRIDFELRLRRLGIEVSEWAQR